MAVESANKQQSLSDMMAFRKDWRAYQFRLLNHLDRYLDNKRLHLVAAPGSGKTVLGLEVIRRINKPTLVLAPTITIRGMRSRIRCASLPAYTQEEMFPLLSCWDRRISRSRTTKSAIINGGIAM